MYQLSGDIYHKIDQLIPELRQLDLFSKTSLTSQHLPDIAVVVFESTTAAIRFVLSSHVREGGKLIANPCFEITMHPRQHTANVVTYTANQYFHAVKAMPDGIVAVSQAQANRFLHDWLQEMKPSGL